jgi:hypothetical protein
MSTNLNAGFACIHLELDECMCLDEKNIGIKNLQWSNGYGTNK